MFKTATAFFSGIGIAALGMLLFRADPESPLNTAGSPVVTDDFATVAEVARSSQAPLTTTSVAPSNEALVERIAELEEQLRAFEAEGSEASTGRSEARDDNVYRATTEGRIDQSVSDLVASGFTQDRASWISRRYEELIVESMEYQFSPEAYARSPDALLRKELGDAEFERYLKATGKVTEVQVWDVIETSPAALAGLQLGDAIISYGGQRVFDARELEGLTSQGVAGEGVVVNIVREGQPMQLILPRGPLEATLYSGGTVRAIRPPRSCAGLTTDWFQPKAEVGFLVLTGD